MRTEMYLPQTNSTFARPPSGSFAERSPQKPDRYVPGLFCDYEKVWHFTNKDGRTPYQINFSLL